MPPTLNMELGGPPSLAREPQSLRQLLPPLSSLLTHPLIFFFAEKKL